MSREREVLALWRYIHRLFSHAQICTKRSSPVNNNRENIFLTTTPPGIHALACKKVWSVCHIIKQHCIQSDL